MTHEQLVEELKKEAREKFDVVFLEKGPLKGAKYLNGYIDTTSNKIKDFLDTLLTTTAQRVREETIEECVSVAPGFQVNGILEHDVITHEYIARIKNLSTLNK